MKTTYYIVFIGVFLCFAFAKAQLEQDTCYFILAQNGLNMRSGPGTAYNVVQKLPYGAQLKVVSIIPLTAETFVLDDGKKKYGQWVEVRPTFFEFHVDQPQYVFDVFLTKHLTTIPVESIHNFVEIYDNAAHDDYETVTSVSSRREMDRGCDVRYDYNPAAKEALIEIIQFEIVNRDNYINQKIIGNYDIDTTWQPEKFKLENKYRPVEWEQYYLPIKNGADSVLIKDHTGEWASKTAYYGQIHELDSYLISGFAEDAEVILVNRTTGKRSMLSSGFPKISPNGAYLISEYFNIFDNTTYFSLREFDEEAIPKGYLISFSSWICAGEFFWIKENEFIMGVLPMDSLFRNPEFNNKSKVIYLKGTIQF